MDFGIRYWGGIQITDDITIYITETMVITWVVMAILISFAIVVRIKLKNFQQQPKGFQNFVELCIESFENLFSGAAGKKVAYLAPWFFTVFSYIMLANMLGATGMRPPTADWGMTFPLAMGTFLILQYASFRYRPKAYVKSLFQPIFLFFPMNVIGELAKPISLSFRLFGNILGGMILISILYSMLPVFLRYLLPVPIHMYFDLAVGILQAFIFTMLSLAFLGLAAEVE
ncbi:MAG: F0F1 ATP synthase subunit A [Defluviitaleaceae bacterium]|nr:F0F1 ATP synthase subunit A [Defluviitaleaceae bacterium]